MRLIDADKLRDGIFHDSDYDNDTINHFIDLVDEQPEVDAEPVVRCKDCMHWKQEESHTGNNGASFCKCGWFSSYQNVNGGIYTSKDDFCSYSTKIERRQNNEFC